MLTGLLLGQADCFLYALLLALALVCMHVTLFSWQFACLELLQELIVCMNFKADLEVKPDLEACFEANLEAGLEACLGLGLGLENGGPGNFKVLPKNRRFEWTSSVF